MKLEQKKRRGVELAPAASFGGRERTQVPRFSFASPLSLVGQQLVVARPTPVVTEEVGGGHCPLRAWLVGELPSSPALSPIGSFGIYDGQVTGAGLRWAGLRERSDGVTSPPAGGVGGASL